MAAAATGVRTRAPSLGQPAHAQSRPLAQRLGDALRLADSGAAVPMPLSNYPATSYGAASLPIRCLAEPLETSTAICPLGRARARRSLVVLGDSQAAEWLPAIDQLGKQERYRVVPLIKLGCSPFDISEVDGGGADFWQCAEFRRFAAGYIAQLRPDIVIVGSEATSSRMRAAPGLDLSQTWAAGVTSVVQRLQRDRSQVILMADTPDLPFDPVDCLTAPHSRLENCVGAPHQGLDAANASTRTVASQTGAGFINTLVLICDHQRCPTVVDQTMTFVDYSHVSPEWSAAVADDFIRLYHHQLDMLARSSTSVSDLGSSTGRLPGGTAGR